MLINYMCSFLFRSCLILSSSPNGKRFLISDSHLPQGVSSPNHTNSRTANCRRRRTRDSGRGGGENYMSRRAPRAGTMPPCRHPGHGAARPGRAAGCRMPDAGRRTPVWIPPRAEGPPGPGKLQFPACPAAGAPAYGTDRAGERVGLKHGFSSMETGPPAAGRSHRRTDGLWGEAGGPGGTRLHGAFAGEAGEAGRKRRSCIAPAAADGGRPGEPSVRA